MINHIESIQDKTIFHVSYNGEILRASQPFCAIEKKLSHKVSIFETLYPGVFDRLKRLLSKTSRIDATLTQGPDRFWMMVYDESSFWLEHTDISEGAGHIRELEKLKESSRKVEDLASLGQMVAQISHELNTPLGICITSATYLADQLNELEEKFRAGSLTQSAMIQILDTTRKAAAITGSNLSRASKIINGLRSLSKDTRRHTKEKIHLKHHIVQVLSQIKPLLEKQGVTVELSIPSDACVYESPSAVSQIFTNLIVNSLNHGFAQQILPDSPEIGITCELHNGWAQFEYRDNGVGIPEKIRPVIFEPFVTGSQDPSSTGLGMSIIREIVESMQGRLELLENGVGFRMKFSMRQKA